MTRRDTAGYRELMLSIGTRVEVREQFQGRWSRGFEVAEAIGAEYWVRRTSDRTVLPVAVAEHNVRPSS